MTPILGFLLVIIVALLSKLVILPRVNQASPIVTGLAVGGIPYILLGMFLGPYAFNLLDTDILGRLEPLISLALGWVGILFGIQLRWRNVRRFPPNYLLFATVQSLIALGIIGILCYVGMVLFAPGDFPRPLQVALILAAIGSISAPVTIGRTVVSFRARGRLTHLLQFVSSLDAFWGILFSGLLFIVYRNLDTAHPSFLWSGVWLLINLTAGVVIGLAFLYLLRIGFDQEELLLLVLGLVVFVSGVGFYLGISPIFLNMIVGIVLAQSRVHASRVMRVLAYAEKPIYLFLLVFAGAVWNFHALTEFLIIGLFLIARYAGKTIGGRVASRKINCAFPVPPKVGRILLSFGGISLAIAFNFQLFYGGLVGDLVISATIVAILVFDELAAFSTVRILREQGEIPANH